MATTETEKRWRVLVGYGHPHNGEYRFLPFFSAAADQMTEACAFSEEYHTHLIKRVWDWKSWWCQVTDAATEEEAAEEVLREGY